MLVYETDDAQFADAAIEALERAGIDCYRTGGSLPGGSSLTVCIYIRNDSDFDKANEVLVQQGAAVNVPAISPVRLISVGIVILLLLALSVLAGVLR